MSAQLKAQDFLWGMVSGEFFPYENYEQEYEALKLAERCRTETERPDDAGTLGYADLVIYTKNLRFNWTEDVPAEYRSLEQWWDMYKKGKPAGECYRFYISEIANFVTEDWKRAKDRAHRIWKPTARLSPKEMTEEQKADPN